MDAEKFQYAYATTLPLKNASSNGESGKNQHGFMTRQSFALIDCSVALSADHGGSRYGRQQSFSNREGHC
jgi:hypothetical protein